MPNYPYSIQLPPVNEQDIPSDGVAGQFLGINGGGQLDWLSVSAGAGDMLKSENLIGLASYPTARTNLGLGLTDTPTFKNLVISTGSIVTSAPVTISQTWNAAAVAFTALKVNATSTNSAADSKLLDLQVGGVSQASVTKAGNLTVVGNLSANGGNSFLSGTELRIGNSNGVISLSGGSLLIPTATAFGWANTLLVRDGADNTLALRNGTNAQTFNVYGTSSSSNTVYSRLAIACDTSGNATLTTQSTGVAGTVSINGVPVGQGKGTAAYNIAIGLNSLINKIGATQNCAVGVNSGLLLTSGDFNTFIGNDTLLANTTGSYNIAAGVTAGRYITGGATANAITNNSVYLGALTKANASNETNQIVIGYDATGLGSNTAVLGNSSITTTALRGNVGIGTTAPSSKLHVALNPATNYTTEKVQFGNAFFGNGVSDYSFMWMGSISTPLTLSNLNYVLGSDGSGTILNSPSTSGITFQVGGSNRWSLPNTGHLLAATDNAYDIGASGANRPRNVYVGSSIVVGASDGVAGSITVGIGASKGIIFGNRGQIGAVGDGVFGFVDFAGTSFSRLQLGPNTDAAPAIARDGAGIKVTGAAAGLTSHIKVPAVAVGSLPLAGTAGVGARAFVNDASSPVFGSAVSGGGAVAVPVYSTGSAWNVG